MCTGKYDGWHYLSQQHGHLSQQHESKMRELQMYNAGLIVDFSRLSLDYYLLKLAAN